MTQYDDAAQAAARLLTLRYSTSFGASTRLLNPEIRKDIFNIYGMVRVADEIVDTYNGSNKPVFLQSYENQVYDALEIGYSTDIILHAFQLTARKYGIGNDLISPFFASMRFDLLPFRSLSEKELQDYIYGSAEVVGLMCLKVFCMGDTAKYDHLKTGAQALGAAFQKVNFLRDRAADMQTLGRNYFPGTQETLTETDKARIIADIERDFALADAAIKGLPKNARPAVRLAYEYYTKLLNKLKNTPIEVINKRRIRIPNAHKTALFGKAYMRGKINR